jgi:D-glycero-alpha-D-manno-heptose 1-phosphate guanylyltransferase
LKKEGGSTDVHQIPAIILAGGLGTRLKETVPDLPKCMAPVAGRPFLFYVVNYLRMQGIQQFVFSLGYKHKIIEKYLQEEFSTLQYDCSIEEEPLGTGGAIQLTCEKMNAPEVLIVNGDTLFKARLNELHKTHQALLPDCTLALKPMKEFDRYGVVEMNSYGIITNFREKQYYPQGNINGGVYLLNRKKFLQTSWPARFSFEKDFLEKKEFNLAGVVQNEYFIDIGIPGDYERAQRELKPIALDLSSVDKQWTLFLDRDGVINQDKEGSYIFNTNEFIFTSGAPDIFRSLTEIFGRLVVVTNQRGVGRGLMSERSLIDIHDNMKSGIEAAGGHIDGIYYCTSVNNNDPMRKPNPGMAVQAKIDFPDIEMSRSIMVGNNPSDMKFGRNAGMYTVFIRSTRPDHPLPDANIDLAFDSLEDFSLALQKAAKRP